MDPTTFAAYASAGAQVGSAIGDIANVFGANKTANANLAFQQRAYEETFQNQLSVQEYQRQLQERMFNREDSAIQRRVADLKAAGLSPVLAAGQGASAGPTVGISSARREAPQKSLEGFAMRAAAIERFGNAARSIADTARVVSEIQKNQAQTESIDLSNQVDRATVSARIEQAGRLSSEKLVEEIETLKQNQRLRAFEEQYRGDLNRYLRDEFPGAAGGYRVSSSPEVLEYQRLLVAKEFLEKQKAVYATGAKNPWLMLLMQMAGVGARLQ